ncbi:MAG: endoglucanase [Myxococcales bacterium]|nr:endoglucanase [Myxococcales bacterium]MCB9705043.1 endoglucanase [Myxococcales bacterium]
MSTTAASASGSSGGSDPSGDPTTGDPTTGDLTTGDPSGDPPGDPCPGYATRYWDCCKAHCGWPGNVNPATDTLLSCDQSDAPIVDPLTSSACDAPAPSSAFTCSSNAPWAVSDTLAYGFAAVPASGDICGRCYRLDFDGSGHYSAQDPGSVALAGKAMIVQATNIGYDVGGGQFDILTPGGGVGLFDACSFQWGVDKAELGATYGGFMTACQEMFGGDHAKQKECVLGRCDAVFADPALAELRAGCHWYVDWYEAADNPNLHYQEVACPPELVAISGIDRGPLNDVGACMGGGGGPPCTQEEMDACNCDWTNGGTTCGDDDGSCCWTACCG